MGTSVSARASPFASLDLGPDSQPLSPTPLSLDTMLTLQWLTNFFNLSKEHKLSRSLQGTKMARHRPLTDHAGFQEAFPDSLWLQEESATWKKGVWVGRRKSRMVLHHTSRSGSGPSRCHL